MDSDQMTPADGISKLVAQYNSDVTEIENAALYEKKRAYGGIVRSSKGQLVEELCRNVVRIAWSDLGRDPNRLTFVTSATEIPLKRDYLERIKNREVREFIKRNVKDYYYKLKTDVHVQVDDEFAIGIECKAYTENAMLKRILVDFTLLKSIFPDLVDCKSCFDG